MESVGAPGISQAPEVSSIKSAEPSREANAANEESSGFGEVQNNNPDPALSGKGAVLEEVA